VTREEEGNVGDALGGGGGGRIFSCAQAGILGKMYTACKHAKQSMKKLPLKGQWRRKYQIQLKVDSGRK
jgi:hypothetical protein